MHTFKDLIKWYFTKSALPYWSVLLLDSLLVIFAGLSAFLINHGVGFTLAVMPYLGVEILCFLLCFMVGFRMFHTYSGVIRYSSIVDLLRIGMAVGIGLVLSGIMQWCISRTAFNLFTIADLILFALLTALYMWVLRLWVKTLYDNMINGERKVDRAFILGVKEGGVSLCRNINSTPGSPFKVVGFVSDEPITDPRHHRLMGVQIYAFGKDLPELMTQHRAKVLIVSPLMMDLLRRNSEVVDSIVDAGVKIMVRPDAMAWDGKSDLKASELRTVDVEDLLPRDKIEVDMKAAADLLTGRVVLITGAAGSIGSEIVRQIASYAPARMVLVDQAETPMHDIHLMMQSRWPDIPADIVVSDIADPRMMERLFAAYRPDYVFHAAAYKHVPMMEDNPYQSIINNVNGTKVVADLAVKYGTRKFVMVSTDKAVNPTNVMGCSKRICEIYVQSLDKALKEGKIEGRTNFVTTRFGNVLGSNGSVIPIFQEQIKRGGPITVTHPDIIRYFMLIPEACKLVIEAGTMGHGGEIFVFDMGEPVRIADLAKRMIKLSGAKNVEIRFTGLRDGEKLYEEVLNDKEITLPTFHPKIKIAKVREYDYSEVNLTITDLIDNLPTLDDMDIVAAMKAMVPEFRSQNSRYSALDK